MMAHHFIVLLLIVPLTLADEAALRDFTTGNNLFTSEVYSEITKNRSGNVLVSPLSAETVLALTQFGAKGETAQELTTTLHLPSSQQQLQSAVKSLQSVIRSNELYTLKSANKIYLKNSLEVKDGFKKVATDAFGSAFEAIDFADKEAAATINHWVEDSTEKKITNLIRPGDVDAQTKAVLVNALYFKGNWSSRFSKSQTSKQNFSKSDNEVVSVDSMHGVLVRNYHESEDLQAKFLELPFEGGDVTFTVVLPNEKTGLGKLEKNIDKVFQAPNYTQQSVSIALPKFKVETTLDFKELLQKLGVKKIFSAGEADLSALAGEKGDLVVDKVVQKTFVDVNEEGIEAAAATFVGIAFAAGAIDLTPPKEFIVDHPFIFYIKVKDLVIFAGRVVDPSV